MGGTVSMPPPDAHVVRTMKFSKIKLKYLKRHFWKPFRKMDKNLSGTIDIAEWDAHKVSLMTRILSAQMAEH